MSLRIRLLLLSLLTLALPWAGREYARQMEAVLRTGQENALLTTAQTLARVIVADGELVERNFSAPQDANAQGEKLFAAQLLAYPLLDGFADELPQPSKPLPSDTTASHLRLGVHGAALYAFVRAVDGHIRYETPSDEERPVLTNNDRVLVITRDQSGVDRAWSLSAVAPGPVIVRRATATPPWKPARDEDNETRGILRDEIRGIWRETNDGFDLELRIPMRLIGAELAIVHLDDASPPPESIALHAIRTASETLRSKLELYRPEGLRISIVDTQGWLLARTGTLQSTNAAGGDEAPSLYRWFLGRSEEVPPSYGLPYGMWGPPLDAARAGESKAIWFQAGGGEPSTVRAASPIKNGNIEVGVISVEQAGGQLLADRDKALATLLRVNLSIAVFTVGAALAFAAWLSRRIRRLSVAAAGALSPQGDVDIRLPEATAHDELGDLSRSYATLLQRFKEYTQYLRTLGSKLSHEFRTPLAIVSSSLDNLAAEKDPAHQTYVQRAREGTARLQSILTAMTEATRVEQSIETAERVTFDLADLLRGVGQAYANTFTTHRIEVSVPTEPCPLRGAPELIVQMLDKLVDNAVDFCPPQHRIAIALTSDSKHYCLIVSNEGPLLSPDAEHKMFDMLVSNRATDGGKPHLGLGLFIVQLIARFHGGEASGHNLSDLSGVAFEIRLPR